VVLPPKRKSLRNIWMVDKDGMPLTGIELKSVLA